MSELTTGVMSLCYLHMSDGVSMAGVRARVDGGSGDIDADVDAVTRNNAGISLSNGRC